MEVRALALEVFIRRSYRTYELGRWGLFGAARTANHPNRGSYYPRLCISHQQAVGPRPLTTAEPVWEAC